MSVRGHEAGMQRFGPFELDHVNGELRKGSSPVRLQAQHLRLLVLLAERPGELVSREQIRQTLWGDETFVDFDRGINLSINKIRDALGDDPQRPRYIETVPRKGYRFISPILESSSAVPDEVPKVAPPRRGRWKMLLVAAAGGAIALLAGNAAQRNRGTKPIQSLAVLPLDNLSSDPDQDYFAEGMTDELITSLARIRALRVVPRTSVMQYKGTKKPAFQIARELSVDAVLEGTVTRAQGRVRITAQLIGAEPETHVWADQYEGSWSDALTLQDDVAKAVASRIQIEVTPGERAALSARRAVNPDAYELYLKGHSLWERSGEQNLQKSRDYFERAIALDPGYAPSWAGLADAYGRLADWGVLPFNEAFPSARAAAQKALEFDPSLTEALVQLAEVKIDYEWDWAGAERMFRQAIAAMPNDGPAHGVYAGYLAFVGRYSESVIEARRAHELEPLSGVFSSNVIWKLYLARRYMEADEAARRLNETRGYILANLYLKTGRQREAIALLRDGAAPQPPRVIELMYLGHGLGVTGDRAEGHKVLDQILSLSRQRYVPPEYIAVVYEGLGERNQALQWFEKAYAEHSMNIWILADPQLDELRSDPRFQNILRRMGVKG